MQMDENKQIYEQTNQMELLYQTKSSADLNIFPTWDK